MNRFTKTLSIVIAFTSEANIYGSRKAFSSLSIIGICMAYSSSFFNESTISCIVFLSKEIL